MTINTYLSNIIFVLIELIVKNNTPNNPTKTPIIFALFGLILKNKNPIMIVNNGTEEFNIPTNELSKYV